MLGSDARRAFSGLGVAIKFARQMAGNRGYNSVPDVEEDTLSRN
jgi:hypothetical protein